MPLGYRIAHVIRDEAMHLAREQQPDVPCVLDGD